MLSSNEIILKLVLSAILGGIIGIEREHNKRPAGFRTHILVTMGSALIIIISTTAYDPILNDNDPMRLAAQVVSGIGFLGAGTILKDGSTVKGLTTAASIWVCGGIGLAVGSGMYMAAVVTVIISILSLTILNNIEKKILSDKIKKKLNISAEKSYVPNVCGSLVVKRDVFYGFTSDIEEVFNKHSIGLKSTSLSSSKGQNTSVEEKYKLEIFDLFFEIICDENHDIKDNIKEVLEDLNSLPGVIDINLGIV